MSFRKGEMTGAQIDRNFPFQIAVPARVKLWGFSRYYGASERGHSVYYRDEWWNVYCFATREAAETFGRFTDGCWCDPKDRGRGHSWARWTPKEKPLTFSQLAKIEEPRHPGYPRVRNVMEQNCTPAIPPSSTQKEELFMPQDRDHEKKAPPDRDEQDRRAQERPDQDRERNPRDQPQPIDPDLNEDQVP